MLTFLPVSKACTNKCNIYRQCLYIVYIYISSTDKTDRHDITEILLKVALNTITLTSPSAFQILYIGLHTKPVGFFFLFKGWYKVYNVN
jgi:hypothetical protein